MVSILESCLSIDCWQSHLHRHFAALPLNRFLTTNINMFIVGKKNGGEQFISDRYESYYLVLIILFSSAIFPFVLIGPLFYSTRLFSSRVYCSLLIFSLLLLSRLFIYTFISTYHSLPFQRHFMIINITDFKHLLLLLFLFRFSELSNILSYTKNI